MDDAAVVHNDHTVTHRNELFKTVLGNYNCQGKIAVELFKRGKEIGRGYRVKL